MRFVLGVLPLFLLFNLSYSQGTGIPPNESKTLEKPLPNIKLVDSQGKVFELYSLKGKSIIISPIYTHCASACPLITDSLKKVIHKVGKPGTDFWLLSFSFDPKDSVQDLIEFQKRHSIDGFAWKVVKANSDEELFKFLDAIDFRFMTIPNSRDFVHPNLLVFISPDMVIKDYVYGVTFDPKELKKSLDYSNGKVSLLERIRPYLFFIGLMGFSTTLLLHILRGFVR